MAKFSRHPKELKGPALNGGRCCNHDKGVTVLIFQGNAVSDYSREIPHEGSKAMYWRLVGGVFVLAFVLAFVERFADATGESPI